MIALMMAAALAQAAPAPQWQSVYNDARGEAFLDPRQVRRDGDQRIVDVRIVFPTPQAGATSIVMHMRFDCRRRTASAAGAAGYAADGTLLGEERATAAQAVPQPLGPENPAAFTVMNHVCRQ